MSKGRACGLTPLEACDVAASELKRAGFCFAKVGRKTHTTYYGFPDRRGLLRLSTHASTKAKDRRFGADNAVACLTFSHKATYSDGTLIMKRETILSETAYAIGRFFLCSHPEPRP